MENVVLSGSPNQPAPTRSQTMYLVLYPQNLEDEVVAMLDALGVPGYTETQKVIGRGPRGHHFDTQVWPGADGMIFTVVNSDQAEAVASALANLSRELEQRSQGLFGLHVFSWSCQQLI